MMLTAGIKLGSYEVLAPIGAGGMGEVYRAHDTKLGRDVAIKVLPERRPDCAEGHSCDAVSGGVTQQNPLVGLCGICYRGAGAGRVALARDAHCGRGASAARASGH